jgi:hypothetical protein
MTFAVEIGVRVRERVINLYLAIFESTHCISYTFYIPYS